MVAAKEKVKNRLKKGMSVVVTTGPKEYRGKSFVIEQVDGEYLFLEGYKTYRKAKKVTAEDSENFTLVKSKIHKSNVMAYDKSANKPSRVGFKIVDGKKVRVLKKSNSVVE